VFIIPVPVSACL